MSVAFKKSEYPVSYPDALEFMEQRVGAIYNGQETELVWFLEHPPLYTGGTSANPADLIDPERFPVYQTGRGGEYTYHGPGMRIGYAMLDLAARAKAQGKEPDLRQYVRHLEEWIIRTLAHFGLKGERREGRVGIWVVEPDGRENKIAAIGIRVRKWVTFHGIALNVNPDLSHFSGIVPCGIKGHGVTSLHKLGVKVGMEEVDQVLEKMFREVF
jgi:lipoyl(octanoyl) transferase